MKIYGERHVEQAKMLMNLGSLYKSMGNLRASRENLETAVRLKKIEVTGARMVHLDIVDGKFW